MEMIEEMMNSIRYGEIKIIIQNGKIVMIEKSEKIKIENK